MCLLPPVHIAITVGEILHLVLNGFNPSLRSLLQQPVHFFCVCVFFHPYSFSSIKPCSGELVPPGIAAKTSEGFLTKVFSAQCHTSLVQY